MTIGGGYWNVVRGDLLRVVVVLAERIDAGDLLVALRALGFEPRKDEVKKLMSDNDKENTGTISKQQFVEIFRAKWVRTQEVS